MDAKFCKGFKEKQQLELYAYNVLAIYSICSLPRFTMVLKCMTVLPGLAIALFNLFVVICFCHFFSPFSLSFFFPNIYFFIKWQWIPSLELNFKGFPIPTSMEMSKRDIYFYTSLCRVSLYFSLTVQFLIFWKTETWAENQGFRL